MPGRFQIVSESPRVIFDVAHNPHAAEYLTGRLKMLPKRGRVLAVIGMLHDKDIAGTLAWLKSVVDDWYCAPLEGPRGATAEQLLEHLGKGNESVASKFQNRLVGTIVLVALGVIVLPGLLDGQKKHYQDEFAAIPLVPKPGDRDEPDMAPSLDPSRMASNNVELDPIPVETPKPKPVEKPRLSPLPRRRPRRNQSPTINLRRPAKPMSYSWAR